MDHTSGSSLESSVDPAGGSQFATPTFGDGAVGQENRLGDGGDGDSPRGVEGGTSVPPPVSEATSGAPQDFVTPGVPEVDAIEFRVIRPDVPVRRLRLMGNRYTFGSAEGCSIRLSDPALRPMHAVLIRDASRILVRAYSVPIQVNGTRITEATLQVGDVLRLGAYQFELLSVAKMQASPFRTRFAPPPRSVFDSPASSFEPSQRSSTSAYAAARGDLPSREDVIWRERLRREIDQWRDRQAECDRRENRCDEREADLRGRESELWSRAETLYRRESRLQSQEAAAFQLYDEFNQRQEELLRLREETHLRQQSFQQREAEFRTQEFEYRSRLEEANRQLQQSRQQAETATEAVARMREQFESLNLQIEELSQQQEQIETREQHQRDEHQRLRLDLEKARDQAIEARAESDLRRQEAEARVEEMAAQIESLQSGQGSDLEAQRAKLDESERIADQLREQVAELQQSVAEAGQESARLRSDYEDACKSVRQLESLVSQSSERGDQDRESWAAEADEMRAAVDQLSIQLAQAGSELSELREANQQLSARLEDLQSERDEARADAQARPTSEEFESLRNELDASSGQLAEMKREYEETLARLEQAQREAAEERSLASAAAIAAAAMAADQPDATQEEQITSEPQSEDSSSAEHWAGDSSPIQESAPPEPAGEEDGSSQESCDWPNHNVSDDEPAPVEQTATWDEPSPVEQTATWDEPNSLEAQSELPRDEESAASESAWGQQDSETGWDADSAQSAQAADDFGSGQQSDAPSSLWGEDAASDSESESAPLDESASWNDSQASERDSAWNNESDNAWSEPHQESDARSESAQDESADESSNVEMTSVWDEASSEIGSQQADEWTQNDEQAGSDWSSHESAALEDERHDDAGNENSDDRGEGDDPDANSLVDGSLASMLIKDIESDSGNEDVELDGHQGTYVMDGEPDAPAWDGASSWDSANAPVNEVDHAQEHEAESWDHEHVEEARASDWSNDPEGYRVEEIDGEGPLDELDQEPVQDDPYSTDDVSQTADDELDSQTPAAETASEPMAEVGDDDSIEAYMNRLLRRAQGEPGSESSQPETVALSASMSQTGSFELGTITEAENETGNESNDEPIDPDAPLVPRSHAPEKNSDLNAMRELANASARSAISRSVRIQTRNTQIQGMVSFACAAGALVCGVALYFFLPSVVPNIVRMVGAAMTIIVAVIYIKEGMGAFQEANLRMQAAEQGLPDPTADTEPPTEADLMAGETEERIPTQDA